MPTRDNTISTKRLLVRIYERGYDMVEKQKRGRPSLGITYAETREAMDRLQNVTHVARELECSPALVHRILNRETIGAEPVTEEVVAPERDDTGKLAETLANLIVSRKGPELGKEVALAILKRC